MDVTVRERLHQEIIRYHEELEERVRLRTAELGEAHQKAEAANLAKSTFLANMSHEIRTPLNAIIGLCYLLRNSQVNAEQAGRLEQIDAAGKHLLSVIQEILDRAKIESGRLRLVESDFSLAELLEHLRSLLSVEAAATSLASRSETQFFPVHQFAPHAGTEAMARKQAIQSSRFLVGVDTGVEFKDELPVLVEVFVDSEVGFLAGTVAGLGVHVDSAGFLSTTGLRVGVSCVAPGSSGP